MIREVFWERDEIEWWYRQNMVIYAREGVLSCTSKSPLRTIHPAMLVEKMARIKDLNALIQRVAASQAS